MIKDILVATDFSDNAYNSAHYAGAFARCIEARVILFHALQPLTGLNYDEIPLGVAMTEEEAQHKLDEQARELHRKYGISITRIMKPGYAADEIPTLADKIGTRLVVIGTHGFGKSKHLQFGNVSRELLENAAYPVLYVPPKAVFRSIEQIAVVQDSTELSLLKPTNKLAEELAQLFQARQTVLQQNKQPE
ncbi:universal stress protein [Pontibacter harenae]|uniref:universal stress protein n=1 Tax=Pontibacter harenae TaxID=2894083 RepID=UPI001E3F5F03|nr:universal stress protein [Pontibacter harenae]MCC9166853.1 universal stress protein [Pontibacter harenae]